MIKILILGNYCSSNRGDAAILSGLIKLIRDNIPDTEITISSFYPEVANQVHKFQSIKPIVITNTGFDKKLFAKKIVLYLLYAKGFLRKRISNLLSDEENYTLQIYLESNLIIAAGGTYLNDNYKPTILGRLFELYLGKGFNKTVVLCGHSIGPFQNTLYQKIAKYVFNKLDLITLRDRKSFSILSDIGIRNPPIHITGDTAFLTNQISSEEAKFILRKEIPNYDPTQYFVSFSVRKWSYYKSKDQKQSHQNYLTVIAQACDYLIEKYGITIVFLSTCTDMGGYKIDDRLTAEEVKDLMNNKMKALIMRSELTTEEIKGIYGLMEMHIGTRMHSNIFALSMSTPVLAIAYEFKTLELMKQLNLKEYVIDINNIYSNAMKNKLDKCWTNREILSRTLPEKIDKLKKSANNNIALIKNLIQ